MIKTILLHLILIHSESEVSASDADEEEHINIEIPTITDATTAMRIMNNLLSTRTVEKRVLCLMNLI